MNSSRDIFPFKYYNWSTLRCSTLSFSRFGTGVSLFVSHPSVFSFDLWYFLNEDNHTGGGVKIAIFGQSIFYLVCFNCDLILIEHKNKHIVTFFLTIGTHCNFLTSDKHFGCKVVLSASFLKSDTGKNYKTSKNFTKQFFLFKQDKLVSVLTCSMHMHCRPIEKNNAQFTYATKIISFAIKK